MNAVIKSGAGISARRFSSVRPQAPAQPPERPAETALDPRDEEIARLRALLAQRDREIARFPERLDEARAEGEAAGREQMAAAITEDRSAALKLLGEAVGGARSQLDSALAELPALAVGVAREVLEAMFDDSDQRLWTLAALIRRHLAEIGEEMVLAVDVSAADFPEPGELEQLASAAGFDPALLTARAELPGGACRIQLRLGVHDVGIDRQWGAFRSLLDDHGETAPVRIAAE